MYFSWLPGSNKRNDLWDQAALPKTTSNQLTLCFPVNATNISPRNFSKAAPPGKKRTRKIENNLNESVPLPSLPTPAKQTGLTHKLKRSGQHGLPQFSSDATKQTTHTTNVVNFVQTIHSAIVFLLPLIVFAIVSQLRLCHLNGVGEHGSDCFCNGPDAKKFQRRDGRPSAVWFSFKNVAYSFVHEKMQGGVAHQN